MNPSSIDTLKNNFFEIQNVNSSFNQYYHLTSPYNAVIETYRSDLDQPYFKISSFSPEHTSHSSDRCHGTFGKNEKPSSASA